jgi:hypothetical protein
MRRLGAGPLTEILPEQFLKVEADRLKDLLRRRLNLFEKADSFGYIESDLHGASPFVEVILGNPLVKEKRLAYRPP